MKTLKNMRATETKGQTGKVIKDQSALKGKFLIRLRA